MVLMFRSSAGLIQQTRAKSLPYRNLVAPLVVEQFLGGADPVLTCAKSLPYRTLVAPIVVAQFLGGADPAPGWGWNPQQNNFFFNMTTRQRDAGLQKFKLVNYVVFNARSNSHFISVCLYVVGFSRGLQSDKGGLGPPLIITGPDRRIT